MNPIEDQIRAVIAQINYNTMEYPIEVLVSKYLMGEMLIAKSHQWDIERQSKFIEYLLMGCPCNPIIFTESDDAILSVVDGKNRLKAVLGFLHYKQPLEGLAILTELNGKTFEDLTESRKKRFKRISIKAIILEAEGFEYLIKDAFQNQQ